MNPRDPIVVVGAGAAGLMASLAAAGAGRPVVLLDSTPEGGKKILISGGGRCNILPSRHEPERFVTSSSHHSLRNMLKTWPLSEQRAFFENTLQLPLRLETDTGKLFPESNRARDVVDALVSHARDAGTEFRGNTRVTAITPAGADASWVVTVNRSEPIRASHVIVATGGLSVPKTGSDGAGLGMAGKLGHQINATYPALTPLLCTPHRHAHLAGVSLPVTIRTHTKPGFETSGGFLITHRGYSGPAVLDASHHVTRATLDGARPVPLLVQWGTEDWESWFTAGQGHVFNALADRIPRRLAEQLLLEAEVPRDQTFAHVTRAQRRALMDRLIRYALPVTGDEGYKKAEVTGGGVALGEVDPRTMESRLHPGLFLCGEILDAFGPIGGYNFQWAWATGRAAGHGAARDPA